jgi:hypothetical protein
MAALSGCSVGRQLVGYKHVRSKALLREQLAHEPHGGSLVPLGLEEDMQDLAFAVNGSP